MADILTSLENELEKHYDERVSEISNAESVRSWDDYNYRTGYLQAIRAVGFLIRKVRNPVAEEHTGEIPSILDIK